MRPDGSAGATGTYSWQAIWLDASNREGIECPERSRASAASRERVEGHPAIDPKGKPKSWRVSILPYTSFTVRTAASTSGRPRTCASAWPTTRPDAARDSPPVACRSGSSIRSGLTPWPRLGSARSRSRSGRARRRRPLSPDTWAGYIISADDAPDQPRGDLTFPCKPQARLRSTALLSPAQAAPHAAAAGPGASQDESGRSREEAVDSRPIRNMEEPRNAIRRIPAHCAFRGSPRRQERKPPCPTHPTASSRSS